ncbi:MAG: phosphotransferase [Ilumatobacter sp.]|uniref:phosphotransferase n=1 Tax=Ilumatobacter sp. TaxID=1967498 RepID=UPI00329A2BE2
MLPVDAWSGLALVEPVVEGNRNEVWRATRHGESCAVRRSRRSESSLRWELGLIEFLSRKGFVVPTVVSTDDNQLHHEGVVVQRWIEGRPPISETDWIAVAAELQRLHELTRVHRQRPGCCVVTDLHTRRVSVDADLDAMPLDARAFVESVFVKFSDVPTAVVHGDPSASNIRMTATGQVGLLDWDESRVDLAWHDLSNLGVPVLAHVEHQRALALSHAWEAANAWTAEPGYASTRLAQLEQRRNI